MLKRYSHALNSYNAALNLNSDAVDALSGRGTVLALTGNRQRGLRDCQRAVQLAPDSVTALNNLGIVMMIIGRYHDAMTQFDQALTLQPDYRKAWNNKAIALSRLGRDAETLASLDNALAPPVGTHDDNAYESWYVLAWVLKGLTELKMGKFAHAIESCEKAQSLDPTLYGAALGKLVSLIASGRILQRLQKPASRRLLAHDVAVVFNALKLRLLILAVMIGVIALAGLGNGTILAEVRSLLPTVFSIGIIGLIAADLWLHRSKLSFVWKVYFQSGVLTYVRAIGILITTLTTFAIAEQIAPPFMRWGWATAIFGQPGNIIFQPFNLLNTLPTPASHDTALTFSGYLLGSIAPMRYLSHAMIGTIAHATFQPTVGTAFIVCFWMMLILGIPFWARLEERIFRQGANSWRQICIRSVQFGLVHLLVGIPILAGFVLIVPGFFFACRYKYVHDSYLKKGHNPLRAQEAGMLASTADHAVYNAILVTMVASLVFGAQAMR